MTAADLKAKRLSRGWTRGQLAEVTGVSLGIICTAERGKRISGQTNHRPHGHNQGAAMTQSRIYARQGDIGILYADDKTPDGKKKIEPKDGWHTLSHGSATGQRHMVAAADADLYEDQPDLLMIVHRETRMEHVEHDREKKPENILIPGKFTVVRQSEKIEEELRRVED